MTLSPAPVYLKKKTLEFLLVFLSFFAFLRRGFMYPRLSYVAECDLELLIFLPPPLKFWDQQCMYHNASLFPFI